MIQRNYINKIHLHQGIQRLYAYALILKYFAAINALNRLTQDNWDSQKMDSRLLPTGMTAGDYTPLHPSQEGTSLIPPYQGGSQGGVAASPYTITYTYDPVGNRLTQQKNTELTNYQYQFNRLMSLTSASTSTFSYDNNGNTISERSTLNTERFFIYNQNQRLIKAVKTATDTVLGEYLYNGNGQRVKKTVDGKTTYFIYDQSGNLIEEADEQGQVNSDYIYLGSTPIARIDEWWEGMPLPQAPTGLTLTPGDKQLTVTWNANPEPVDGYKVYWGLSSGNYINSIDVGKVNNYAITGLTNGITYYVSVKSYADINRTVFYHTDHLGTPVMMTDKNGNKVWEGEFLPFGEAYSITGTVENNLRFSGQYYDQETGLHQNGYRDYKAEIGRYLEKDPIGFRGGM